MAVRLRPKDKVIVDSDGRLIVEWDAFFNRIEAKLAELEAFTDSPPSPIVTSTVQATTSGTAFDFTGLPTGIKRITLMFDQVSLSGTDEIYVQLGDSGGIEATGYLGTAGALITGGTSVTTATTAFNIQVAAANRTMSGIMRIVNLTGNVWVCDYSLGTTTGTTLVSTGTGTKTLSATLDRVRVTRSGTNTFDSGQINLFYET